MTGSLFSANWYRVAELRPRLRTHARIGRHVYRGQPWYVLEDIANQRVHRFLPAAHAIIGLMDGQRTLHEVWEIATGSLGDDAPTQDETIRLLAQLHGADVLQCDVTPDMAELFERYEKRGRKRLQGRLMNPFAIQIPLFDPDRQLRRVLPLLRPLLSWGGAVLWLGVVLPAIVLAGIHWNELTEGLLDRMLAPQNLLLIWLLFPVIKILHELGHGVAARFYGGEVHDMGVMFLVFTPVPYVDASSASAFPEKQRRALVASAGMIVEVFIAALALYVWLAAEPGTIRTLAYNAMLIGGVTTLTFNANPLLRFDGYYILSDLIEIPNLRQRSNAYFSYLVERYGFGLREASPPDASGRERTWLVGYAVSAFAYRMVVIAFILLFVFDISVVVGTLLAALSAIGWIGTPLYRGIRYLFTSPRLWAVRGRAFAVVGATVVAVLAIVFVLPLPLRTQVEGVVWIPDEAFVRAQSDGFVERVVARPGSRVEVDDLLIDCSDPDVEAQVLVLEARLRGLQVRESRARLTDRAQSRILEDEIRHFQRRLERARERLAGLAIHSRTAGIFVVPRSEDLPGRFVRQGDLLAHVVEIDAPLVRAVVSQEDVEFVRDRLRGIQVRLIERPDETLEGQLSRLDPSADPLLASAALGSEGGGETPVDPRDSHGRTAITPVFQVEIALTAQEELLNVGGHAYVRFDHGPVPLASRWYRSLRQLFLSRLDV